ncbi:hypothetical protein Tsubulata_012057 [Turnera subulata]|uniref:B-like cyclin n=1 Tax=Turnera subulata TaxID=218843 RepID=A0A9Q0FBE7_9ROSI|nr:hypothetical protein Tsubulata_012057 [Turnera subulata]
MHSPSRRPVNMNKENTTTAKHEEPTARITRSRAKAMGISGRTLPPLKPSFKQDQKLALRAKTKRAASDENKTAVTAIAGLKHKRRAALKDVSNSIGDNPYINYIDAANNPEARTFKQARKCPAQKNVQVAADIAMETSPIEEDVKTKLAEDLSKIRMVEAQEVTSTAEMKGKGHKTEADAMPLSGHRNPEEQEGNMICEKLDSSGLRIVDIDSNIKDPQSCSLYAADIFKNKRVNELDQRASANYMESLQRDITPSMRGILIDWLVEVSEEYTLVPDTLYLTVNIIDRFLSQNYIEKQRLQLLGVTCMLIASKYEEICAPRVEEFCFITDNTYTREEVLKMESQVLNFLYFQLSVPTTKTFLRRFIQAAQAPCKVPCVELELLANYLAELTLAEYNFLKFLPSLIAASAVFLARWTLNQSDHPWNPTLEHYTNYNASQLKTTVLALEDLQLNTNGCTLTAIREKYRQPKVTLIMFYLQVCGDFDLPKTSVITLLKMKKAGNVSTSSTQYIQCRTLRVTLAVNLRFSSFSPACLQLL